MKNRRVKISPENFRVDIQVRERACGCGDPKCPDNGPDLQVAVYAQGLSKVDRNNEWLYCWVLGPKDRKLAERLKAAVLAGKIFQPFVAICEDVNGKTYRQIDFRSGVYLHRRMNAGLRELGF